jgi:hypothetical protein
MAEINSQQRVYLNNFPVTFSAITIRECIKIRLQQLFDSHLIGGTCVSQPQIIMIIIKAVDIYDVLLLCSERDLIQSTIEAACHRGAHSSPYTPREFPGTLI